MKKQSVASVKARLLNRSKATGKTMQEFLVAYGLERTVYRISISPYSENSRFKDYYDLYVLASKYDFDQKELQEAFKETFEHRGTKYDDVVVYEDGFAKDAIRQSRWNAFTRKKKAVIKVSLQETVDLIRIFTKPVIDGIQKESVDKFNWNHTEMKWK